MLAQPKTHHALMIALAAILCPTSAFAAGQHLEAITMSPGATGDLSDSAEVVISSSAKPDYSLFRLNNPTRVVIDLRGAEVGSPKMPERPAKDSLISTLTTTQFKGQNGAVARVVAVMRDEVELDVTSRGDAVVLTVKRSGVAAAPKKKAADKQIVPETAPPEETTPVVELTGDEPVDVQKANRLHGVDAKERAGGTLVKLSTNGEVERYEIEEVDDPPRLVIDLYGVKASKGMDRGLEAPAIKRARVGLHHDKTRVVLDGAVGGPLPHYDVAASPEGLTIMFDGVERVAASKTIALGDMKVVPKAGFTRVQFKVSEQVSVRTVGNGPRTKTIAVDGVAVDPSLLTRTPAGIGVLDAVSVSPGERASTIHIGLHVNTDVEHSVWQKDGLLFWDVRGKDGGDAVASGSAIQPRAAGYAQTAASAAHAGATAKRRYRGKKITIDLQDADVVNVIRLLGDVSGKNVVVGEDVKGKVTIKLKNVPWDQALDIILRTKRLGQEVRGGIIRIAEQSRLDEERAARLKLQEELQKKQPTSVRLIPVNYAVAGELVPQVQKLLSERGRVANDERTNVIIVEDIRDNLDQAEKLVQTLDTQTPLVLIEARMVEAQTTFSRSLGIQWGGGLLFSQRGGNPTGLIFPNNVGIVGGADSTVQQGGISTEPGVLSPTNYVVNLPAQASNTAVGMNLGSVGNYGFINAKLSAAESTGEAKTISSPKVTTLNNKQATITQGVQIPIVITTNNQIQTNIVNAALTLDVTPHVTADGAILMSLTINNDSPGPATPGAPPPINTKSVKTEILVKDGDTAVIGGIYTRQFAESYNQTPFLGSIPVLGWLFKNYTTHDTRNEMLVFLTPRIINRDT
jgi:type IV pilus assembly protein PilQ